MLTGIVRYPPDKSRIAPLIIRAFSWYGFFCYNFGNSSRKILCHFFMLSVCQESSDNQFFEYTIRYVAGTTPVKFWEFFAAHFIGTFKVAILDAYFGSLLLSSVVDSAETQAASRNALIGETIVIIVVSVILTNVATGLFTTVSSPFSLFGKSF